MRDNERLIPKRRFKEFLDASDWEQRKLGELANIVRGASPRPIQDPKWFDKSSDIGWLRISDVTEQNGRINKLEQKISKIAEEKTRVLLTEHLLLSIAATVGKPVINYTKTGVHDGFLIFLNPKFNVEFMFQWLEMFRPKWQKYGQPGSQVNLNSEIVRNHEIILPAIDEQNKLSSFFKRLDDTIALHQRKLQKLKALKTSYLYEMFPSKGKKRPIRRFDGFYDDWEQYELIEIADLLNNLRIPVTASDREKGNTPYYGANGIQDYVSGFTHEGEFVLIAEDGANDLINYPVNYVTGRIWVNNHAHVIKGKGGQLDNLFLASRIKSMNISSWLVGGGRAKLNGEVLKKIPVLIPSFSEQVKIGQFFKQFDDAIVLQQNELEKLKSIKTAYLNEMFV